MNMKTRPAIAATMIAALAATQGTAALAGGLSPELLLSSGWCSSSYNTITNVSTESRVQFHRDGSFSMGGRGVRNASDVPSEHHRRASGYWQVQGGELFINEGGGFGHVPTSISRNSNGWFIVRASGVEYRQC